MSYNKVAPPRAHLGFMAFLSGLVLLFLLPQPVFAAHPLITDDTGTQGEGKFQVEMNLESSHDHEGNSTEDSLELETIISYGLADALDLVLGIPYQRARAKERGLRETQAGVGDLSLEIKWRFFEEKGWSFAVKPGVSLATGEHEKDLGSGRISPSLFFIATKELEPWSFHLNLGYIRNENRLGERTDLWHASLACEWEILKDFKVVANAGAERNSEKGSSIPPAFILGGFIYSLKENLGLDIGLKAGLTRTEPEYSFLAGLALRF